MPSDSTPFAERLALRSGISGIGWPAVPGAPAALAWTLQQQLDGSQWWPAPALLEHQLGQLGRLLHHAVATVPWYREHADYRGRSGAGTPPTPDDWRRLPLLRREQVQGAGGALDSTAVPRDHGSSEQRVTTGSTGRPVRVRATQLAGLFWHAFTLREHLWHGRDFGAKLASIRAYDEGVAPPPDGVRASGWGPSTAVLVDTGPAVALNLRSSLDEQLAWLAREQPRYLLTYPTLAAALARRSAETGAPVPGLTELRTLGEALPQDLRALARDAWHVPVVDMYSAQEVGYIALQCPRHEHYHVQSENVLLEVLDDAGEPCAPGEVGQVVVTSLHNFATPLLRYAIGDMAEVGEPCPCGRGLPVLRRVLGRVRNMLRLPGGGTRWPVLGRVMPGLERLPPLRQYQLVQKSIDRIEARIVTPQPLDREQEALLTGMWQRSLGHPFEIRIVYHATLPRGPGGKFEEFVCELD